TYRMHVLISRTVGPFPGGSHHPVVSGYSMNSRNAAGIHTAMPHGSIRRHIIDIGIITGETITKQAFEASFLVARRIAMQVIPAHLVDHDTNHQFRPLGGRTIFLSA